jgi:hypothetical protein
MSGGEKLNGIKTQRRSRRMPEQGPEMGSFDAPEPNYRFP